MTDYTTLIARLEAATELTIDQRDAIEWMIAEALGYRCIQGYVPEDASLWLWLRPDGEIKYGQFPDWTGSIDAALSLLPEGCDWGCEPFKQGTYFAEVKCPQWTTCGKSDHSRVLALLIAIFRARQTMETTDVR